MVIIYWIYNHLMKLASIQGTLGSVTRLLKFPRNTANHQTNDSEKGSQGEQIYSMEYMYLNQLFGSGFVLFLSFLEQFIYFNSVSINNAYK